MKRKTREVLDELRGSRTPPTCGCGRPLERRTMADGKGYVTHPDPDDEDHHYVYFSGIRVRRITDTKPDPSISLVLCKCGKSPCRHNPGVEA